MPMTVNIKVDCHENNGKEYSKAEQIPTEILQEILSYLQNPYDPSRLGLQAITRRSIPLVCKAWHDVGMQCLYRRLDFTDDDRPRANLVLRTLEARGDLADYVTALHFPWLIMLDESWTNEQKKLTCYVRIVALCHNLVTLSVPASLHGVLFSSDTLPHACLLSSHASLIGLLVCELLVTILSAPSVVCRYRSYPFNVLLAPCVT